MIASHQLALSIHIHIAFVAIMTLEAFFCPARVHVLLHPFRGLICPAFGHFALLNRRVLVTCVVVAQHPNDGSSQTLTTASDVALLIEMPPLGRLLRNHLPDHT